MPSVKRLAICPPPSGYTSQCTSSDLISQACDTLERCAQRLEGFSKPFEYGSQHAIWGLVGFGDALCRADQDFERAGISGREDRGRDLWSNLNLRL